jgi:hypothetical protein
MNQHLERLDGLAPFLQRPALMLIERCQQQLRRTLCVVHTWRSVQEQWRIYQQGRTFNRESGIWEVTDPTAVVTRALPGTSAHNVITRDGGRASMALDVIPYDDHGQLDWNVDLDFWDDLYELSWKVGLDPLGDPIGSYVMWDRGHFEEPAWRYKLDGLGLLLPSDQINSV